MEEQTTTSTQSASKMSFVAVAVVGLLLLGGVAFFMMSQNNAKKTTDTQVMQVEPTKSDSMVQETPVVTSGDAMKAEPSGAMKGTVKEFTVTGKSFSFTPNELKVKKGDTVKITFKNNGGFHDWVIDEFNARTKQIGDGEIDTVEFTADKAGTFEFYCSVGNHRQMGMVGNLIVE